MGSRISSFTIVVAFRMLADRLVVVGVACGEAGARQLDRIVHHHACLESHGASECQLSHAGNSQHTCEMGNGHQRTR
jgi:hypothetical protein